MSLGGANAPPAPPERNPDLDSLNSLHEKYVLVPTDKAANNVIMLCKKYYLDVVIKELNSTKTYVKVNNDSVNVVSRHLVYMVKNDIAVHKP